MGVTEVDRSPAVPEPRPGEDSPVVTTQGVSARRRRRQTTPRPHAVQPKFSAEEYAVLAVAAPKAGLTVTGYVASSAVAVARGEVTPLPASTGDAARELVAARTQLRRYGVLLNQAVAKLHATGAADAALPPRWTAATPPRSR